MLSSSIRHLFSLVLCYFFHASFIPFPSFISSLQQAASHKHICLRLPIAEDTEIKLEWVHAVHAESGVCLLKIGFTMTDFPLLMQHSSLQFLQLAVCAESGTPPVLSNMTAKCGFLPLKVCGAKTLNLQISSLTFCGCALCECFIQPCKVFFSPKSLMCFLVRCHRYNDTCRNCVLAVGIRANCAVMTSERISRSFSLKRKVSLCLQHLLGFGPLIFHSTQQWIQSHPNYTDIIMSV